MKESDDFCIVWIISLTTQMKMDDDDRSWRFGFGWLKYQKCCLRQRFWVWEASFQWSGLRDCATGVCKVRQEKGKNNSSKKQHTHTHTPSLGRQKHQEGTCFKGLKPKPLMFPAAHGKFPPFSILTLNPPRSLVLMQILLIATRRKRQTWYYWACIMCQTLCEALYTYSLFI